MTRKRLGHFRSTCLLLWMAAILSVVGGATVPPPPGSEKCLDNAHFNVAKGRCECNGGLDGDGDLCCYDKAAHRLCEIRGDPHFYSAYDMNTYLDVPCPQSIARSLAQDGGHNCLLQLYVSNKYVVAGNIYPERFTLAITIDEAREKYIQVFGQKFWHPLKNELIDREDLADVSNSRIEVDGVEFLMDFNTAQEMWSLSGCGTEINFRKFWMNRIQQPLVPGLCIKTPRDQTSQTVDEGNLCGLKSSYDLEPYTSLEHKLLANVLYQQPVLEGQENPGSDPEVKARCAEAGATFKLCPGPLTSRLALERCSGFLLHPTIRICMVAAGMTEVEMLHWFNVCVTASCASHMPSCDQMRTSYIVEKCHRRVYLKCPGW